jgi:peptidoglycan/LPS O-acetylase OafA/YrhL
MVHARVSCNPICQNEERGSRLNIISLKPSSSASAWFDLLRGIAALYVLLFHLRPVLFVGYANLQGRSTGYELFYGMTSLGYEFVMLFFVLSGFLVGSSVMRNIANKTWSWKSYLVARLTRLWIVLVPALMLTLVWVAIETSIYHDGSYFHSSLNLHVFLGNLLFLQGVTVPNFAQNLPLWSLTYEFWYYMLFPCVVLIFKSKTVLTKVAYTALVIGLVAFLGKNIVLYFLIWLLGVVVSALPPLRFSQQQFRRFGMPFTLALVLGALMYGKYYVSANGVANFDMIQGFPADFLVSLAFACFLYTVVHGCSTATSKHVSRFSRIASGLAGFSYTLYLTHYPIINFLRISVGSGTWGTWQPNMLNLILGSFIMIGILLYAWIISRITERWTPSIRKNVTKFVDSFILWVHGVSISSAKD